MNQFSILVYGYNICLVNVYTMPYTPTIPPPPPHPPPEEGGGSPLHPPPTNTPLDDVNHRLAWLNTHSIVIKIKQNQYKTPTKVYYNVWRATSSSSRFQIWCNTRRFKSASWFVGFTLKEQSQIPHFCGICHCSLLRGGVAEVWNLVESATTACSPSLVSSVMMRKCMHIIWCGRPWKHAHFNKDLYTPTTPPPPISLPP